MDIKAKKFYTHQTLKLASQIIDKNVVSKDPVYFDNSSNSWKKATSFTSKPTAVYEGLNIVIPFGSLITTGLIKCSSYYLDPTGGLTTIVNNNYIGSSRSNTELIVNIIEEIIDNYVCEYCEENEIVKDKDNYICSLCGHIYYKDRNEFDEFEDFEKDN